MGLDRNDGQPVDRAADIKQRIEYVVRSAKGQRIFEPDTGAQASASTHERGAYRSAQEIVYDIFVALREYEPRAVYLGITVENAGGRVSAYHIKYKDKKDNKVRTLTTLAAHTVRIEG